MKSISILTKDNYSLSAHLFEPEISNNKVLLINSATGVRQQVYFSFAKYFAEHGYTVITYDYRGIGLSKPKKMKNFCSSMTIWGSVDYNALTDYIQERYIDYQKFCLGHSVGALILGMNEGSSIFEKFIFAATQKSYLGNLNLRTKIQGYLGFGLVLPVSTWFFGYFPAHRFGLGESLPKGNAFDWRTLLLDEKSTNKVLEKSKDISKELTQGVFVFWADDDPWLNKTGVTALLDETYPNMKPTYRLIKSVESPKKEVGHINFFRSYNQPLWNIVLKEL